MSDGVEDEGNPRAVENGGDPTVSQSINGGDNLEPGRQLQADHDNDTEPEPASETEPEMGASASDQLPGDRPSGGFSEFGVEGGSEPGNSRSTLDEERNDHPADVDEGRELPTSRSTGGFPNSRRTLSFNTATADFGDVEKTVLASWKTGSGKDVNIMAGMARFADEAVTVAMPNANNPGRDRRWRTEIAQSAELICRMEARVIREPYSREITPCNSARTSMAVHGYVGPDKSRWQRKRRPRRKPLTDDQSRMLWRVVNPTAAVPMRPRPVKRMTWLPKPVAVEEWEIRENAAKEKRDTDMANKLGYETLLGNLVHIEIPGAPYLNRSWNHFLSQDIMAWGFPYLRDSRERPQARPPPRYLVHQLKEKLWKYPKARLFKSQFANVNENVN